MKVVFITHPHKQCGVYQYGKSIFDVVSKIDGILFSYRECGSSDDVIRAVVEEAPNIVFYNYHHGTIPFALDVVAQLKRSRPQVSHLGFSHELIDSEMASFDFAVCSDPTLTETGRIFKTGRVIPQYDNAFPVPAIPTFGTFGFCCPHKGYERLIDLVQEQFDEAVIRINLAHQTPFDTAGGGARARADSCRKHVVKPGIRLEISHVFMDQNQLMDFLAQNCLNAFLYDDATRGLQPGNDGAPKGISSATDFAMAVKRPVAVSNSNMFRHLFGTVPSIVVGQTSLKQIMENGLAPLAPLYAEWTIPKLRESYASILHRVSQTCPQR